MLALKSAFESISDEIMERFLGVDHWAPAARPVERETFYEDLARGGSKDALVQRFLEQLDFMEELTEQKHLREADEVYRRYCDWHPFVSRTDEFLEVMVKQLTSR